MPDGAAGLHGCGSMCLPVPTVENLDELNQRSKVGVTQVRKGYTNVFALRRFAPGLYSGALPRTPASFRLSNPRFAGRQFRFLRGKGDNLYGWASRWFSPSRRWRCRPSQPRIGLANRFSGFWSDRTPLAHDCAAFLGAQSSCKSHFHRNRWAARGGNCNYVVGERIRNRNTWR